MADLNERLGPPTPGSDLDTRLTGGLEHNQAALSALQGSEKASFTDELLDVPTLVKLGLAVAGGLSGSQDLQALGLGLGTGALGQVGSDVATSDEERQKRIDDLTSLVDKQQQRLVSLLQSQPGMFVDEEGEAVTGASPAELAAKTGLGVELSPAAMNTRAEMTRNKEKVWSIQGALFEQAVAANRPEQAAQHLAQMFNSVGIDTTAEEASRLVAMPLENVPAVLAQRADVSSVVDLMAWSAQNDKPWWHPDAPKLRPKIETVGGVSGAMQAVADQGIARIAQTMERLKNDPDPAKQALWREYVNQPFTQIEILNDDPKLLNAVKKVYVSTRTGEEVMLKSLEFLTKAMQDPNSIEALTSVLPTSTPEDRGLAVATYFRSLFAQTGLALNTMAIETEARRWDTLSVEELEAELIRRRGGEGQ